MKRQQAARDFPFLARAPFVSWCRNPQVPLQGFLPAHRSAFINQIAAGTVPEDFRSWQFLKPGDAIARGITYPTEHRIEKVSNFPFLD
jgi:hypothetical protein